MKYTNILVIVVIILICLFERCRVYAIDGYSGYDSGISSGAVEAKELYNYEEVQFISGEPVLFTGTLTIKKTKKNTTIDSSYKYSLTNSKNSATLTREITYTTLTTKKDNNQETSDTKITGKPKEVIIINGVTYTLQSIDFMQSVLVDKKPSINYNVGNMWAQKIYTITGTAKPATGASTAAVSSGSINIDVSADIYGYNEYWGNTETISYKYLIQGENIINGETDKWGGKADVITSSSVSNQMLYMQNLPEIISFTGGYLNRQYNNNLLEYNSELPEFDQNKKATDLLVKSYNSYTMDSYPKQQRLVSVDFPELKGHWAEMDIKKLFGLEILNKNDNFKPESYTTRGEYCVRVYNAVKDVPEDPLIKKTTNITNINKKYESPFKDVPNNYPNIKEIVGAYDKGIIQGRGDGIFGLNENLKFIDAVVILIRAMGLENATTTSNSITYKDKGDIPLYALNAAMIAEKIGLIKGDLDGYLKPNENLTNARSSALIVRFIEYMSEGIKKDYRDGILTY